MQSFLEKLNYIQELFGLSNSYMAHLIGYTAGGFNDVKTKRRRATDNLISSVADAFGIPIEILKDDDITLIIEIKDNLTIRERLLFLRKKHNLSQTQLGRAIGVPVTTISSMENRDVTPSIKLMRLYSDYFHVKLADLFKGIEVEEK